MFFLKKIMSVLLAPVPVLLLLLMLGLYFLWFTKKKRTGKIIVSATAVILLLLSFSGVSNRLLMPLERRFPPLFVLPHERNDLPPVKWILVLGCGHISDPTVPVTSQVSPASLVRLTEGVRLHRQFKGSKLILMGGAVFDRLPEVETEGKIAEIMGIDRDDLILEKYSKETEEQARYTKTIVGNDLFIVVTSASHMPRAIALLKKEGMDPIPAPTNHRVMERQGASPEAFIPSSRGLGNAEIAIYEYLCLCWSKIRNKI